MPTLIRFDHASVSVADKTLLSGISFAVRSGEKVVLCGKSGAGKSSVLKTLLGLLPVTGGQVYFQERNLDTPTLQALRQQAAYIGQEPVLGAETVREALLLPFQFKAHQRHPPNEDAIKTVLQQLQLPYALLKQNSRHISGGEKQRIALARALLLGKNLYLLDEITSALDSESKQAVFAVFRDPALTVLSIAHDPDWIRHCDAILQLENGCLSQGGAS